MSDKPHHIRMTTPIRGRLEASAMPKVKNHRIPALVGPNGELVMATVEGEDDPAFLWDCTEHWPCEETEIRKAVIVVSVPILGVPDPVECSAETKLDDQATP